MASLKLHGRTLVCISANKLAVYSIGSSEKVVYTCERIIKQAEEKSSDVDGSDHVLASGFSPSGKFFAVCDDWKQLILWETGDTWTKLSTRSLIRRCTSLKFTQCEEDVVVADKSGDVYRYSTSKTEEPGELLLGHVSMLLDVALCNNDKYVVTSDRDEKIRVSHYPNAYNIHGYCLAHTEFVSRLAYFPDENLLISGSGDGTLQLWNYLTGKRLGAINCGDILQKSNVSLTSDKSKSEEKDSPQPEADSAGNGSEEKSESETMKPSVKCLVIHPPEKLVMASFEGVPAVLIFQLLTKDGHPTLDLKQTLKTSSSPWDLDLDLEGHLWVLLPEESSTLAVFSWKEKEFSPTTSSDILKTVEAVNADWDFFKGSLHMESIFKVLNKSRIDNVKEYMNRKNQRIEDQKKRKSKKTGDTDAKKAKLEDDKSEEVV